MRRPGHLRGCGRLGMSTGAWQIGDAYGGVADWGYLRGRVVMANTSMSVAMGLMDTTGKKRGPGEARRARVPLGACGSEIKGSMSVTYPLLRCHWGNCQTKGHWGAEGERGGGA